MIDALKVTMMGEELRALIELRGKNTI